VNGTLIIGGLAGICIIALLLLILTIHSEQKAQEAAKAKQKSEMNPPAARKSVPESKTGLAVYQGTHEISAVDKRYNNLLHELHSLHQQAQAVENKLATLIEAIEHLEPKRNQVIIEEEQTLEQETIKAN
jgi:hypothetical protein